MKLLFIIFMVFSLGNADSIVEKKILCKKNDLKACFQLQNYYFSRGNKKDGIEYGSIACNLENSMACNNVGVAYEENGKYQNKLLAKKYYLKACDLGNDKSCLTLGDILSQQDNSPDGLLYYEKACELLNSEACTEVGYILSRGLYHNVVDKYKALIFYKKGANLDNSDAQLDVGIFYATGSAGLKQDLNKAIEYFKKSAEQKNIRAYFVLGVTYYKIKDFGNAALWIKRAMNASAPQAKEFWNQYKLWQYNK